MKAFDRTDPANRDLYDDRAYKIINADRAMDTGLTEDVIKNGRRKTVKVKTELKQHLIITFSRKMMEYQRYIRNRQIERAKKLLKNLDPDTYKKGPNDVTRASSGAVQKQRMDHRQRTPMYLTWNGLRKRKSMMASMR